MITSLGKKAHQDERLFFFNYEMQAQVEFICQIKEERGECPSQRNFQIKGQFRQAASKAVFPANWALF
jgi:hypothetical protein